MKLEYIVVYENSPDEFNIEHCRVMVMVTVKSGPAQIKILILAGPILNWTSPNENSDLGRPNQNSDLVCTNSDMSKSCRNTVLFVNRTICFSENLFLVTFHV